MQTFKVTFANNKPVQSEAVDISAHRDTRKMRTVDGHLQIDWLIVCCDEQNEPMQLAEKLADIFIKATGGM